MNLFWIWLIIALAFFLLELITTGIAVICLSFGAVAGAIFALCGSNPTWQLLAVAIVTILSFIYIRPVLMKLFYKKGKNEVKTNVDALIGRVGFVSEYIDNDQNIGRVAIDGDDWKAVSQDNTKLAKGTKVEVISIDSIILTVKKL